MVQDNTESAATTGLIPHQKLGHWNTPLGVNQKFILVYTSAVSGNNLYLNQEKNFQKKYSSGTD